MTGLLLTVDFHAAIDGAKIVHAVVWEDVPRAIRAGRRTVPTVCGRSRTRPYVVAVRYSDGASGQLVMPWPPRVSTLPDGQLRCRSCHGATGGPRPHPGWDRLAEVPAA